MTVDEAARILREMYYAGEGTGLMVTGIHLFGILYADDLESLSIPDIISRAGLCPSYRTEVQKGKNLAEYVKVVNAFP